MTPEKALQDLEICLKSLRKAEEDYKLIRDALVAKRTKIESWLIQNTADLETVPDTAKEDRPFTAWLITKHTDASAVEAHMQIDDVLMPQIKAASKEAEDELKNGLEVIESWALKELNERGAKNFSTDSGTISRTTVTYYKIADKALLVKDALANGYASELTLSIPRNSKFMSGKLEEDGELPAGVTMSQTYEVRVTKK